MRNPCKIRPPRFYKPFLFMLTRNWFAYSYGPSLCGCWPVATPFSCWILRIRALLMLTRNFTTSDSVPLCGCWQWPRPLAARPWGPRCVWVQVSLEVRLFMLVPFYVAAGLTAALYCMLDLKIRAKGCFWYVLFFKITLCYGVPYTLLLTLY